MDAGSLAVVRSGQEGQGNSSASGGRSPTGYPEGRKDLKAHASGCREEITGDGRSRWRGFCRNPPKFAAIRPAGHFRRKGRPDTNSAVRAFCGPLRLCQA